MMKKKNSRFSVSVSIYAATVLVWFCCLGSAPHGPERVKLGYEVITDSVFTRMPGELIKCGVYAVWMDPFASRNYLHVVHTIDKTETAIGTIGQGPEEFATPQISPAPDGKILIYDLNSPRRAVLSIGRELSSRKIEPGSHRLSTRQLMLDSQQTLFHCPQEEKPFVTVTNGTPVAFGKTPLDLPEKISNGYDCLQGNLLFSSKRKLLVFSAIDFPYTSFYRMDRNGTFTLTKEVKQEVDYTLVNQELKLKQRHRGGSELVGTKDYIVKIDRDRENDRSETRGMDFSTLPQTLFVYNYDGKLLKIAHVGVPLLRLGGDESDNVIYAMSANPDFCLIRIDLDQP